MALKLISWNVNGIRACHAKGLVGYLQKESPDLFCLQETKAFDHQCGEIIDELKSKASFDRLVWSSAEKPGYSGVLTGFRAGLKQAHDLGGCGIKDFDREGRVIATDLGPVILVNLYFPNGAASPERHLFKMSFLKEILQYFKALDKKKPLIMTGDFNIAHKAIDIHDPVRLDGTSGFMPEEREWMDQLVSAGFEDSFRVLSPEARDEYSWWSYRQLSRQRNKGWRIDYFFVSARLKAKVKVSQMLQNVQGSDHCPLLLKIDV